MEPMTLGSPGSPMSSVSSNAASAASGANPFLPSFLMGDSNLPTTPRNNTLSPTRGRTQLAFGSPRIAAASGSNNNNQSGIQLASPPHYHRSTFAGGQPHANSVQQHQQHQHQQPMNPSGPPTMGLFDTLRAPTPPDAPTSMIGASPLLSASMANISGIPNQSQLQGSYDFLNDTAGGVNASFSCNDTFSTPGGGQFHARSTMSHLQRPSGDFRASPAALDDRPAAYPSPFSPAQQQSLSQQQRPTQQRQPHHRNWVTVYGFPPAAITDILAHFSQCGHVIDRVLPPHGNGNWMHLKYSSRLECDKAVNCNERIIGNTMMIGVVYCRDSDVLDKENVLATGEVAIGEQQQHQQHQQQQLQQQHDRSGNVSMSRVRSLGQLSSIDVIRSPPIPQRSAGLVNKAIDMLFGW